MIPYIYMISNFFIFLFIWQIIDFIFNTEENENSGNDIELNENNDNIRLKEQLSLFFNELRESTKYKIYFHLKCKNFYITTGLKYGADFLLYYGISWKFG